MSDIITLDNLKIYLRLPDNAEEFDDLLGQLISAISEVIQKELGRSLVEAEYEDAPISGNGLTFLCLPAWPVTDLTSIEENGVELTEDEDFSLHAASGILEKLNGTWMKGSNNIIVNYTAGYTVEADDDEEPTMPKDLQLMCYHKIARAWKEARTQGWGETSRSFPDGSVNVIEAVLFDKEEMAILDNYRRIKI
jgi:hypothetical protein